MIFTKIEPTTTRYFQGDFQNFGASTNYLPKLTAAPEFPRCERTATWRGQGS